MKTFLVLALLAVVATMATATVQFDPRSQYETQQPFSQEQQPFSQEQQPFEQQQQQPGQFDPTSRSRIFGILLPPVPRPRSASEYQTQQPFAQQQQQFSEQQQPFQQQQQQPGQFDPTSRSRIFGMPPLLRPRSASEYQTQQPFPQTQQPFAQPQPFSQGQQQFPGQQQPFMQQQQPFFQPYLQQQLNPCRQFVEQKCSPVGIVSFLRLRILQQISCLVMQNQCCRQLVQIPEQLRCPAIHNIVDAVIMQQQQQQQQWFLQPLKKLMGQEFFQPQLQQAGQGFTHSQQLGQYEAMRKYALQTLPAMCNVQVPVYCRVVV